MADIDSHALSADRHVRGASPKDAAACAAIYAPYVSGTPVSFELDSPAPTEMARRIASASQSHAWLVLVQDERIVGYAYGSRFHPRPAYRWACEVSVYMELDRRRTGGGRALYESLLPRLANRGFRIAMAVMTLPNEASVGLHRALGFEHAGVYRRIGFKLGAWRDVAVMQRMLGAGEDPPAEPH